MQKRGGHRGDQQSDLPRTGDDQQDAFSKNWVGGYLTTTLKAIAENRTFLVSGFHARLNEAFVGALVSMAHYRADRRVSAVIIEINRVRYTKESSGEKSLGFDVVAAKIRRYISDVLDVRCERERRH